MKDLKDLEWINGKTRLLIKFDREYINVYLESDYPKTSFILLYISIKNGDTASFDDLQGNGYFSGLQRQGFGKLIVNTGIEAIKRYFVVKRPGLDFKDIKIIGKTSDEGDPEHEPEKSKCRDARRRFWESFGLKLKSPEMAVTSMSSSLMGLKPNTKGQTINGCSVNVNIKEFWTVGERPIITKYDIDYLASIRLEDFDLTGTPTQEDIALEESNYQRETGHLKHMIFLCLLLPVVLVLLFTESVWEIVTIMLPGSIMAHIVSLGLSSKYMLKLQSYSRAQNLIRLKYQRHQQVKDQILAVEDGCNGIVWRILPYMREVETELDCDQYKDIEDKSKENRSSVCDDLFTYIDFITRAKKTLSSEKAS